MEHNLIQTTDLAASFREHAAQIREAVERVLQSGWYILGCEVTAFEEEFASYCGVAHGVGVASGTDAVALALKETLFLQYAKEFGASTLNGLFMLLGQAIKAEELWQNMEISMETINELYKELQTALYGG